MVVACSYKILWPKIDFLIFLPHFPLSTGHFFQNGGQARKMQKKSFFLQKWPSPMLVQNRVAEVARPPVAASAGAPALAGSPSIRAFVAKSVLTRITRYWIHYFQLFSATSTVKMPVFMKNYKFCWQNCKKNDVYVAKICNGKIRCFCRENLQTRALR